MRSGIALLALLAWLSCPGIAVACEIPGHSSDVAPLASRKPLLGGDEIRLAAGFGMRIHPILNMRRLHASVDWAAPIGTPVVSAAAGQVRSAARDSGYGNTIVIDHGSGWQTLYAHLSALDVREGDCVTAASVIGKVGATGLTAGPQLHFEVRRNGESLDPLAVPIGGVGESDKGRQ